MMYHMVSWTVNHEKEAEQMLFAQNLAARANQLFPEANIKILRNVMASQQAYWIDTFESLAAWEAAANQLDQDEQWLALWTEAREKGLVAPDTVHTFYRVVA